MNQLIQKLKTNLIKLQEQKSKESTTTIPYLSGVMHMTQENANDGDSSATNNLAMAGATDGASLVSVSATTPIAVIGAPQVLLTVQEIAKASKAGLPVKWKNAQWKTMEATREHHRNRHASHH